MGRRLTWVRLCLSTVVLAAAFSGGTSSADGINLYQNAIGSVIVTGETRIQQKHAVVPVDRTLFTTEADKADEAIDDMLIELRKKLHVFCGPLVQLDGTFDRLAIDRYMRKKTDAAGASAVLQNLYGQYLDLFSKLAAAKSTNLQALDSPAAKKAILSLAAGSRSREDEVTVSVYGCTRADELVLVINVPSDVNSDPYKLYEVADYGRFDMMNKAFARINLQPHWIQDGLHGWALVDLGRCQHTAEKVWTCAKPTIDYHAPCTPLNLDGCPVSVEFIGPNYHNEYALSNGSLVIATQIPTFSVHAAGRDKEVHNMSTSGMLLADLPEGSRLAYGGSGQHKVKGNATVGQVRLTHLKTHPLMFQDYRFLDADFDKSQYAFTLERGNPDLLIAHPTDAFSVATAFVLNNGTWFIVIALAVVASIVLTALAVSFRRPLAGVIREAIKPPSPSSLQQHFSRFVEIYPGAASRRSANKASPAANPTTVVIGNEDELHSVKVVGDAEAEAQRQSDANNLKNMLRWAEILQSYGCPEERLAAAIKQMAQADADPNNNETTLAVPTSSTDSEGQYATLDDIFDANDHLDLVLQEANYPSNNERLRLRNLLGYLPSIRGLDARVLQAVLHDYYAFKRDCATGSPAMRIFMKSSKLGGMQRGGRKRRHSHIPSITLPERKAIEAPPSPSRAETAVYIEEVAENDGQSSTPGPSGLRTAMLAVGKSFFDIVTPFSR
ncbi:hypothetical protein AAVH_06644 [Aphelenchoides avenae]|nr:hypothetical protein AAVH_06644 [Aphelenchus avenae]